MPTSVETVPDVTPVPAAFELRHITAGYGRGAVIHDVSIAARQGEVTVIIGPNGAGKSSLLKAAMGLIQCSEGCVAIDGAEFTNSKIHDLARRGLGYVPQVRDVFDALTVTENLEMGGYLVPKSELASRMNEVFEFFPSVAARKGQRASKLSGGERKMLAIGRVMMMRPRILILDEPTASLAPKVADAILRDHVAKLGNLGVAVLLVEQRVARALSISSNAYIMVDGAVAVSGHPDELGERGDIAKVFLRG